MRSSNPALSRDVFTAAPVTGSSGVMTIGGTTNKCMILLAIVLCAAGWVWHSFHDPLATELHPSLMGLMFGGGNPWLDYSFDYCFQGNLVAVHCAVVCLV